MKMTEFVENLLSTRQENIAMLHQILDATLVTIVSQYPDGELQMAANGLEFETKMNDTHEIHVTMDLHAQTLAVVVVDSKTKAARAIHTTELSKESSEQYKISDRAFKTEVMNLFSDIDQAIENMDEDEAEANAEFTNETAVETVETSNPEKAETTVIE